MSNESAVVEPYGLYHLELDSAVLQIGKEFIVRTDLEAALEILEVMEFCVFDEVSEWIWIREMAAHQVLEGYQPLKERDWRIRAANKFYDALPEIQQLGAYYDQYADLLRLEARREARALGGRRAPRGISPLKGANPTPNPTPTPEPSRNDLYLEERSAAPANTAMVLVGQQLPAQLDASRKQFEEWWVLYPIKTGKGKAWTAWLKHKPPFAKLMDTTRAYLDSEQWAPKADGTAAIHYPATFLNNEMWEDTPTPRSGRQVLGAKNRDMVDRTKGFGDEGANNG